MMMERIVLDSWAILAWLQGEDTGEIVRDLISWAGGDEAAGKKVQTRWVEGIRSPKLFMSLINLGEVFYILGQRRGEKEARETVEEIKSSVIGVVPVSEQLVFEAASLKIKYPIAYADSFVLATTMALGGALVTGDPELRSVEEIEILWIGKE